MGSHAHIADLALIKIQTRPRLRTRCGPGGKEGMMPRGGYRPGAGAPRGNKNRLGGRRRLALADPPQDRPRFASARDFALWCLNAPDAAVPMEAKIRAMAVLAAGDAPVTSLER